MRRWAFLDNMERLFWQHGQREIGRLTGARLFREHRTDGGQRQERNADLTAAYDPSGFARAGRLLIGGTASWP